MQHNDILVFFAKYIESECGIVYAEHNYFQLQNRLEEIAKLLGIKDIEALYQEATKGIKGPFKQLLLDISTNNETSFFRDNKIFRAIEEILLKSVAEKTFNTNMFRIWSAASSSGQEALSVSMLINDLKEKNKLDISFSILGTDLSQRVLNRANEAVYTQLEVQRGLPMQMLVKYFKKDEQDKWTASSSLTKNIHYKKLNLKEPFPISAEYHFILCRNVLIYQSVQGKIDILNRLTSCLVPGGYLVLGSGESLLGLSKDYDQIMIEGAVVYRKKAQALIAA